MPVPGSGTISINQFHVEAGGTSGTQCSLNDSDIRGLIGKGSGVTMSFNEWYGASASIPDFSQTMTFGQIVTVTGTQYAQIQYLNRGYRNAQGITYDGQGNGTNGETTYGSITTQNSNFFSNQVINRVRSNAQASGVGAAGFLLVGVSAQVTNNDTAFTQMVLNGSTYNRSAATYSSNVNQSSWSWSVSAPPSTIGNAWSPWPSTSSNAGTNVGTCNLTFKR